MQSEHNKRQRKKSQEELLVSKSFLMIIECASFSFHYAAQESGKFSKSFCKYDINKINFSLKPIVKPRPEF